MTNKFKRILSSVLCLVMLISAFPMTAFATDDEVDKLELSDGYIKVTVSAENGGFLIDTVEGDKLDKADNNKNLLYPAEDFDTSYTSFRVTRTDGKVEEYIFGRKYGFLGLASEDVVLVKEGNSIVATWSVKDITVKQSLTLLDETASLHGMVNISYTVLTESDDVESVRMRVMYDTALGFQDYATYEVLNRLNEITHVTKDTIIDNSGSNEGDNYSGTLFAVDNPYSPGVTAYTVDAVVDGETISPYMMAFGHWNNLASSVFDFVPGNTTFTNAMNQEYMTADSAYAMYYDLGAVAAGEEKSFSTYYGIYSNATLNEDEGVAINFPALPASMELKEGNSNAYKSQLENGSDGDIHLKMMIENITDTEIDEITVVVETMNKVYPYADYLYHPNVRGGEGELLKNVVTHFKSGEEIVLDAYFNVEPLVVSEYRRFKVLCYNTTNGDELTSARLIGSREFYLFCPGELGETIVVNTIDPDIIYYEGTRNVYLSGLNFGLLKDTTAYTAVLRPIGGGEDTVIPGTNVVVDTANGTMNLVVDQQMAIGTYQVIIDWIDPSKEDVTSSMLRLQVTDDITKVSPTYGVVTVEKANNYTDEAPAYTIGLYHSEDVYKKAFTEKERVDKVYLEFRGNFGVRREDGRIVEVRANSLTDIKGNALSTINISDCLDVECGTVALIVENSGEEDQTIHIDIEGKVYTTGARTSVWDGVCAITSFENGNLNTMLQYDYEGEVCGDIENSVANANAITLLWPGAASTAQTIAGMFFEFRYCQFGFMALEKGTVTEDTPRMRVISFGAELSPDFLLPSDFDWGSRETSSMEVAQLALAKQNYTADQLRDVQERFARDQQNFLNSQKGTLNLYVTDILFGGGFAGFNTTIEVTLPEYFQAVPSLEGTLKLKVLPANKYRDGRIWEFYAAGAADLIMIELEASLGMKETPAGVPAVDSFYAYVEGGFPGINLDGVGCFWIIGLGGGMSNIYDTMFVLSEAPPLALTFTAAFRIYQVLEAKASMTASLRGFSVKMEDISIARINVMDRLSFSAYWYPELSLRADMYLNILDIITGGGYIVVEENKEKGDIFWEAFARASVQTPDLIIIPSITLGSVDLGVNSNKIWGALHVLKMDMGVTYYWGGDVDFAFGKYDAPESTYPLSGVAVGKDPATGKTLYMNLGTNARLAASANSSRIIALDNSEEIAASINSTADGMSHTVNLGSYDAAKDMLLSVVFTADSKTAAEQMIKGNGGSKKGLTLTKKGTSESYPLVWVDNSRPVEEQTDANAMFSYDEETKRVTVAISFTESDAYNCDWTFTTGTEAMLGLYELDKLPGLDSVTYSVNEGKMTVETLTGYELASLGEVAVHAISADGQSYYLGAVDAADPSEKELAFPTTLPSGTYTLRVVASNAAENICSAADSEDSFDFVNPLQPDAPAISDIHLGGNYSIEVDASHSGEADGYITTIYERVGDEWVPVEDFTDVIVEAENGILPTTLTLGGSYTTVSYVDAEGNPAEPSDEQAEKVELLHSLEAGKTYRVGVAAYRNDENGVPVYSAETVSADSIVMVAPVTANVTVQAIGAKSIAAVIDPHSNNIDVVNSNEIAFEITTDMKVAGEWTLDGGTLSGTWSADDSGVIALTDTVSEGEHMLTLSGANENGDEFRVQYLFRVDCSGPMIEISSPVSGSFFGGNDGNYAIETVDLVGRSEVGSQIFVKLEGEDATVVTVDESGSFHVTLALDESALTQTLTLYAIDAAGNESATKTITLNNAITGAEGVYLGIFLDGENVTNKTIPTESKGKVELRFVAGEHSVAIPDNSKIAQQIDWSLMTINGIAELEDGYLATNETVHAMLQATYGLQSASVILGGNEKYVADDDDDNEGGNQGGNEGGNQGGNQGGDEGGETEKTVVLFFSSGIGYRIVSDDTVPVPFGGSYSFKVEINEGYYATNEFAVSVNGVKIVPADGIYTITNIQAPKHIQVGGVERVETPEVDDTPDHIAVSFTEGEGYTVKVQETLPIPYDSDLHFSVEIAEGYSATDSFAVVIGGETLTAENGSYTVKNIRTPKHIQVVGVADITAPAVTVNAGNKSWNKLSDGILFTAENVNVSVAAQDVGSGVKEVSYFVSKKQMTLDELKAIDSWTAYTGGFEVKLDPMAVVYVKATDNAGNATYACTDGLAHDEEKPVVQGIENGGVYKGSVTVTVIVTDFALATIAVNGETVYKAADGKLEKQTALSLDPASAEQTVVITDLAGNSVTYTVTVEEEEVSTTAETEDETESKPVESDHETESESDSNAPDADSDNEKKLTWLWVALVVVIAAGIAVAAIFFRKRR